MSDRSTQGGEDQDGDAAGSGEGALPLRGGITAFVVISVVGIVAYRAIAYFVETHRDHPVPFDSAEAFSAYAPAAGLVVVLLAALVIWLVVRRRR